MSAAVGSVAALRISFFQISGRTSGEAWDPVPAAVELLAIAARMAGRLPSSRTALHDQISALFEKIDGVDTDHRSPSWQELFKALRAGVFASYAIGDFLLRRDGRGLARYRRLVADEFAAYLAMLCDYYAQERRFAERARAQAELGVEQRRVPERDRPFGARRSVTGDHRRFDAEQRVRELAGVGDRRRGEQELRVGAVDARKAP